MPYFDKIITLTKQLYPTGRVFKIPLGGHLSRLHNALAITENQLYIDAVSILNNILPDNSDFSATDASDWERRLGLITNSSVSLTNRKLAILRKINHPGTIKARQNYLYLEGQLQAAGFNVSVFENRFPDYPSGYITQDPLSLSGGSGSFSVQLGDFQLGDFQLGGGYANIIANHIEESRDLNFDVGDNLRSTFFVGGSPVGTFANVDAARKNEFRQLILKIKPVQSIGYLFINYV